MARVKKGQESYEQVLLMFEKLHHDVRRLENIVVQYLNQTGVTWDKIGEVMNMSDEGARRRYTKADTDQRRRRRKKKA